MIYRLEGVCHREEKENRGSRMNGEQEKGSKVGRDRCASIGNIEELFKRKREGGVIRERKEEGEVFRKCRKTARSPETEKGRRKGLGKKS